MINISPLLLCVYGLTGGKKRRAGGRSCQGTRITQKEANGPLPPGYSETSTMVKIENEEGEKGNRGCGESVNLLHWVKEDLSR